MVSLKTNIGLPKIKQATDLISYITDLLSLFGECQARVESHILVCSDFAEAKCA